MPPNEETGTIISNFGKMIRGVRSVCEFRDNVVMTTKSGILLLTYIAVFNSEKSVIWGESRINITKVETKLSETNIVLILKKMLLHLHKIQKRTTKIEM